MLRIKLHTQNQSGRNNIKIIGIEEDKKVEKSWHDMEKTIPDVICQKLRIQENLHIEPNERAHRVRKKMFDRHDGSKNRPHPIIAKFMYWKEKEKVLRAARELKLEGVQFYPDFAKRRLQQRASQIPKWESTKYGPLVRGQLSWTGPWTIPMDHPQ